MKKYVAILLGFVMMVSVVACGGSAESKKEDTSSGEIGETQDGEAQLDISVFEEITVVDNEQCLIKITSLEPENMWGYTVNVYLENKSVDKTYMYSLDEASIDGVSTDPLFASEVAPGKKENASINFMDAALEDNGLEFTDIELVFKVYDTNDYSAEPVAVETVHVYPKGKDAAITYVREEEATDKVIVENDSLKMVVIDSGDDEIWGYMVDFYIVNKTDIELMISADEVAVNGYMMDPFFATSVPAGKSAFVSMYWSSSEFEENNIEKVEEITFALSASDANDWMAEDIIHESITINP